MFRYLRSFLALPRSGRCTLCKVPCPGEYDLCAACETHLPWNNTACYRCGTPLSRIHTDQLCGDCLTQTSNAIDTTVALWRYQPPIDRLIIDLKFNQALAISHLCGHLLHRHLVGRVTMPELIVPMPLHPQRQRQRGFNQAREIARVIGRRQRIPLDDGQVFRHRATETQSLLAGKERQRNVKGAFDSHWRSIPQSVAIVDDVIATGSTVRELAKCLKRSGVKQVSVWALAHSNHR